MKQGACPALAGVAGADSGRAGILRPDRWRCLARTLRPASTDRRRRLRAVGEFLALERDGRATRLWKLNPWGGSRLRRDETTPTVRERVRGFCEHEPSRICHFAGERYEPPQYGATAKAHDPVGREREADAPWVKVGAFTGQSATVFPAHRQAAFLSEEVLEIMSRFPQAFDEAV
jgi:hypothetical protein